MQTVALEYLSLITVSLNIIHINLCVRVSSAPRFRTLSSLLVCLKITSLVCKRLSVELCSSDHFWTNVTLNYCTFKIRHLSRWMHPWASSLSRHGFCLRCYPKLWFPLQWRISCTIATECVYLYLVHVRLFARHYRGGRREERVEEFLFLCLF